MEFGLWTSSIHLDCVRVANGPLILSLRRLKGLRTVKVKFFCFTSLSQLDFFHYSAMAAQDFKEEFKDSFQMSNILQDINITEPTKDVLGHNLSITALLLAFISTQSQNQQTIYSLLADLDGPNKDAMNAVIKNNSSARTLECVCKIRIFSLSNQ